MVRRHEEILSNLKYTHEKISNLNNYMIQNHPAAKILIQISI